MVKPHIYEPLELSGCGEAELGLSRLARCKPRGQLHRPTQERPSLQNQRDKVRAEALQAPRCAATQKLAQDQTQIETGYMHQGALEDVRLASQVRTPQAAIQKQKML